MGAHRATEHDGDDVTETTPDDETRRNPGAPDLAADTAVAATAGERTRSMAAPGTERAPLPGMEDTTNRGVDRGVIIGQGLAALARWSVRGIVVVLALGGFLYLLGRVWVGVFPLVLALLVTTVLWPPTAWLRRHGVPAALSAIIVLLGSLAVFAGVIAAIAPSLVDQSGEVASAASGGLTELQDRLGAPPFNVDSTTVDELVSQAQEWLRARSGDIASGVFTGVSVVGNALVTLALVLVLVFFFLKDGPNFLPFVRRVSGRTAGRHLTEVSVRSWNTLSGFIRTQAIVSAVDAVLIATGLVVMQVPLAFALAVLTFFGGFVPIIGAVTAGALAVLVALVSQGLTTALVVLAIVLAVQQLEGNVLQPLLQGRSMQLHAGVILLAVAAGSTLFGIVGAFLAVPVIATVAVVMRYISEQVDLRTGDLHADEVPVATKDGEISARQGELAAAGYVDQPDATTLAEELTAAREAQDEGRRGRSGVGSRLARTVRSARQAWREDEGRAGTGASS